MSKMNAMITGANKDIGLEIDRQLGQHNYVVWLGCRNGAKGETEAKELRKEGIEANCLVLDVTDDSSARSAATRLGEHIKRLDILVNNAGMNFGPPPPTAKESTDHIRMKFETNMFGPVRVTQAFLPLLRKAKTARIVVATSGLGPIVSTLDMTSENWTVGFDDYSASKAALNIFIVKFAKGLAAEGIKLNGADPGLTNTKLGGHQGKPPIQAVPLAVRLATLDGFGPTAGFFRNEGLDTRPSSQPW